MKRFIALLLICAIMMGTLCACDKVLKMGGDALAGLEKGAQDMLPQGTAEAAGEQSLTLDRYAASIAAGEAFQLQASAASGLTLQWRSSDESVALVNSQGLVTGVGAGVANITCFTGDAMEASCTVTVTATASSPAPAPSSDFIFPHSSSAYLTEAEIAQTLAGMSGYSPGKSYAQDAINEIYARNGYVFQTEEVQTYYQSKSWYVPDYSFSTADLNEYEKHNIALLQNF